MPSNPRIPRTACRSAAHRGAVGLARAGNARSEAYLDPTAGDPARCTPVRGIRQEQAWTVLANQAYDREWRGAGERLPFLRWTHDERHCGLESAKHGRHGNDAASTAPFTR